MKKLLIVFIALTSIHVGAAQEIVRVASYNIKFLKGNIPAQRKTNLLNVIEELDADVIGLQEIADRAALENIFPPDKWHIVIDDDSGDRQDLAVVARKDFEILGFNGNKFDADDRHFLFADGSRTFFPSRRDLLAIEIGLPNSDDTFHLLVAHTKARVGGRHTTDFRRAGAAREMIKKLERDFDERDYILLGDFNDSPDDAIMNILESGNPNMPAAMENSEGAFMINLSEPLYAQDHVTFGRNNADRLPNNRDRINTTRPGIRVFNFENLETDVNTGDCLFDQILIPTRMKDKYVAESFTIFAGASSVNGNSTTRASDHSPVFAEFVFGSDEEASESDVTVAIIEVLPNPDGDDTGNEYIILKNLTNTPISLEGWSFKDRSDNEHPLDGAIAANSERKIVLTGDVMPLNNTGDEVKLLDSSAQVIVEVTYKKSDVKSGVAVKF